MKYLRRFLLYPLLILIVVIIATAWYFLGSQAGLQTALKLAQDNIPGRLEWTDAAGKITGPLDLENLSFQQEGGLQVAFDEAHLRWKPSSLLSGKLQLDKLQLHGLTLHLPPPSEEAPAEKEGPIELPDITLPISLKLNEIDLTNIRIFPYGAEEPILIEQVSLQAAGETEEFRLVDLSIKAPQGAATVRGYLQPQGDYPLDLTLLWNLNDKTYGTFKGDGTVQGTLKELDIRHELRGTVDADIQANVSKALNDPTWEASITASSQNLGAFAPALEQSPLSATIHSAGSLNNFTFDGQIDTALEPAGPLALSIKGDGNLDLIHLRETLLELKANGGQLALNGDLDLKALSADVKGNWQRLAWPVTSSTPDYLSPEGEFQFSGNADTFDLSLSTRLDGELLQPLTANINASGKDQRLALKQILVNADNSETQLKAQGEVDLKKQVFNVNGDWASLAWPMQGTANFASPDGNFDASGTFEDYRFTAQADLEGLDIPEGNWNIEGKGTKEQLTSFIVEGKTLGGSVNVDGKTAWSPAVNWDISASAKQLDPGVHWPELPGNIDVQLKSEGELTDEGPVLTADISQMSGRLKDKPLSGNGQLRINGQAITIDNIDLQSLGSRLKANGTVDDRLDLEFNLDAPTLSEWGENLGGQFTASGELSGTKAQPSVNMTLSGADIKSGETLIDDLKGNVLIDLAGNTASTVDIQANKLKLAGQSWDSLSVNGKGKPKQHELELQLKGEQGDINTRLAGGMNEKTWRGALEQLELLKTELGDWQLQQPAEITASAQSARVDGLCLQSEPSKLCIEGAWDAQKGSQGNISLTDLNPERFRAFLPEDIRLDNRINLVADGSVNARGIVNANAKLDIASGSLTLTSGAAPTTIDLGASEITATVRGEKLDSDISLDLGKLGGLAGQVGVNGFNNNGRLSGSIKPDFNDLSIIPLLAPQLQEVAGTFGGELQLGGTLASPQVSGQLDLENFAAEIPQVAMILDKTELHIRGSGADPLQIEGKAHSGDGDLSIKGELNPTTQFFNLSIKGKDFVVANSNQLQAVITPDLNIAMNQDGMSVKGKVEIPRAFVDANGGESGIDTVDGSGDVVIVDETGQRQGGTAVNNLNLDVQVVLGDDIKVEAGEFSGQLKGNLEIQQTPQLAPRGTGTIEVVGGDYVIYGQQLSIQRGRILFSGGPVDNPQLDMDVARRVEAYDVLAGARIRGSAQSPLLQLYSEPAMPDASVLSYILLGQPPGTKGGSYTLGKFLTPDLYVSYGIGLFNAINTFNMRYRLTEKLSLQAASGLGNSADLIYNIER